MRHWHPYIKEALAQAGRRGICQAVALAMAPHYSRLSIGAYQRAIDDARGPIDVAVVPHWFDHPLFLDAVAARVREALQRFPPQHQEKVPIIFTAHSLPERVLTDGDPYADQLRASVAGVMTRVAGDHFHALAFQSAGRASGPWLGPDAGAVLEALASDGERQVLICPVGFVADHLEVLYDVDIEYQRRARELGIHLERTDSLNAHPLLIDALADLATSAARARGWLQ